MFRWIQRACSYVCDLNNTHVVIKPPNCSQQYTIVNKPPPPPLLPPTRWHGPHKTKFIQFSTTSWANSPHCICFGSRDKNIKALKWWGGSQAGLGRRSGWTHRLTRETQTAAWSPFSQQDTIKLSSVCNHAHALQWFHYREWWRLKGGQLK